MVSFEGIRIVRCSDATCGHQAAHTPGRRQIVQRRTHLMAQTYNRSVASVSAAEPKALAEIVSRQRLILIMIGTILGMLLSALDQTVVGTALPRIVANLGGLNEYAWVVTAYL